MTEDHMIEIARGNIERNFAPEAEDDLYEEAYTLAFDALHDAGVDNATAGRIAAGLAQQMTGA